MVVLSHHHESIPVHVEPELEQHAALGYLQSRRRGCGGYTAKNGVLFHKAGESTKAHPHRLHAILALHLTGSRPAPRPSTFANAHEHFSPIGIGRSSWTLCVCLVAHSLDGHLKY
jgi:hypothetical protein